MTAEDLKQAISDVERYVRNARAAGKTDVEKKLQNVLDVISSLTGMKKGGKA